MSLKTYKMSVNGIPIEAVYSEETVANVFIPLIENFNKLLQKKGKRVLIYLAAAPGVGKTTLSLFLEGLAKERNIPMQSVGIDGFHHHQEYLLSHTGFVYGKETQLVKVKGAPETYDLEKLRRKILELGEKDSVLWPIYDRQNLHDVVEDSLPVTEKIVLLEGNWLLLKDENWRGLKDLCDYSIYIGAEERFVKDRLITRKILGGSTPEAAAQFYENADGKNVRRVLQNSMPADLTLMLQENGDYIKI